MLAEWVGPLSTRLVVHDFADRPTKSTCGGGDTYCAYDGWGRQNSKWMQDHSGKHSYLYGDKLKTVTSTFPDEGPPLARLHHLTCSPKSDPLCVRGSCTLA